jgi:hypothetical protein
MWIPGLGFTFAAGNVLKNFSINLLFGMWISDARSPFTTTLVMAETVKTLFLIMYETGL